MTSPIAEQGDFVEVIQLIENARQRVNYRVNVELIDLYWNVGEYVSLKIASEAWGKNTVKSLANYIKLQQPNIRGFSPQNIWRMRQFFETYCKEPKLSTLLRELPWSSNLHILTRTKLPEEREFYLRMATQHRWQVREVARQIDSQLFFHRGLNCLLAIELKVTAFQPEHLGKLSFYLEALDRDHRKPHENPAIGVLLCASKDDEVVEYALSRSLSPALIAEYKTKLPDKKLLQAKLHEFYALNVGAEELL